MSLDPDSIQTAAALVAEADALLIGAGAGMGVDSGLPDFRGSQGFWRAYPALGRRGLDFYEVANPRSFDTDAALAWGFYGHRLALYRSTQPHAGFQILRRWGARMPQGCGVFTSNVDGHFQRSGFDAALVTECHGSIHHLQCTQPCSADIWPADVFQPDTDNAACQLRNAAPTCPQCGALARPNILMFGDSAWVDERAAAQEARLMQWLENVQRLLVVELGAGTAIASVRRFSHAALRTHQATLLRINPREAAVPRPQDLGIAAPALAALQAIDEALQGR